MRKALWLVMFVVFGGLGWVSAQSPDAVPFAPGEVVVFASPDELPGELVVKYLPHSGLTIVRAERGRELGKINQFRAAGRRATVNRIAEAFVGPNDPYLQYQWHFYNVQAPDAWSLSTGQGVDVAVLDSGLATGGNDGIGCVKPGYDAVDGDADPADGNGHGTHVSGTIAQATNNGAGVAGLAYGACIIPVKVLNDQGSGTFADIAEGIHWAVDHGAKVINMSLGVDARYGLTSDPVVDPALDYAFEKNVTVVCASGNNGSRRNVSYPAIYPTTIAVGATDYANKVTSYSNKGAGLDLVAPGGRVSVDQNRDGYGDGVLQETRINGSFGYYFFEGTSMASPHVAAAAAMLYAYQKDMNPVSVLQVLASSARDLDAAGYDSTSGWGLLQVHNALLQFGSGGGGGTCTDKDGDGYCAEDGDCNDDNAAVYPGANDTRGKPGRDGVDNDCNGVIDG